MPVPKRKRSRARRDSRFANKGLLVTTFSQCSNCTKAIAPHQACLHCGHYKGKKVMVTKLDRGLKRLEMQKVKKAQEASAPAAEDSSKS